MAVEKMILNKKDYYPGTVPDCIGKHVNQRCSVPQCSLGCDTANSKGMIVQPAEGATMIVETTDPIVLEFVVNNTIYVADSFNAGNSLSCTKLTDLVKAGGVLASLICRAFALIKEVRA